MKSEIGEYPLLSDSAKFTQLISTALKVSNTEYARATREIIRAGFQFGVSVTVGQEQTDDQHGVFHVRVTGESHLVDLMQRLISRQLAGCQIERVQDYEDVSAEACTSKGSKKGTEASPETPTDAEPAGSDAETFMTLADLASAPLIVFPHSMANKSDATRSYADSEESGGIPPIPIWQWVISFPHIAHRMMHTGIFQRLVRVTLQLAGTTAWCTLQLNKSAADWDDALRAVRRGYLVCRVGRYCPHVTGENVSGENVSGENVSGGNEPGEAHFSDLASPSALQEDDILEVTLVPNSRVVHFL